jgi:uncharacterized protein (TIGR02444 family)
VSSVAFEADADESLWGFAVRSYALPGVAERCLRLQDEHGLDVDVVLAVLWSASRGVELDDRQLARVLDAAAPARGRVLEIRALRRAVGEARSEDPRWEECYASLKGAELAAERVELMAIEVVVPDPLRVAETNASMLARRGLRRYAAHGRGSATSLLFELAQRVLAW